jgi:hypothetical protein
MSYCPGEVARSSADTFVASLFAPGFGDIPPFFVEDVLRTDGRARKFLGASELVVAGRGGPFAFSRGTAETTFVSV